jgi:hypothetical protein
LKKRVEKLKWQNKKGEEKNEKYRLLGCNAM